MQVNQNQVLSLLEVKILDYGHSTIHEFPHSKRHCYLENQFTTASTCQKTNANTNKK